MRVLASLRSFYASLTRKEVLMTMVFVLPASAMEVYRIFFSAAKFFLPFSELRSHIPLWAMVRTYREEKISEAFLGDTERGRVIHYVVIIPS